LNDKDFVAKDAGHIVRAIGGYWAFVPAPLPPRLSYDADLDAVVVTAGGYNVKDDGGYIDSGWNVWGHASRLAIRRSDRVWLF
jgi:hypothetical protein